MNKIVFLFLTAAGFPAPTRDRKPMPGRHGPGTGDSNGARGGARSALDSLYPPPVRDKANRSKQIWVDQEVGSLSKLSGVEVQLKWEGGRPQRWPPTTSRKSRIPSLELDRDFVAAPSRSVPVFDVWRCRGLREQAGCNTVRR